MPTTTEKPTRQPRARKRPKADEPRASSAAPTGSNQAKAAREYFTHVTAREERAKSEGREVQPADVDVALLSAVMASSPDLRPTEVEKAALKADNERVAALKAAGEPKAPAKAKAPEKAKAKPAAAKATTPKPSTRAKGKLSFHAAAEKVLEEASAPIHVKDLTEEVLDRKLSSTSGKTPVASMAAVLLRDSREKGSTFVQTGPATFDLRRLNPRAAKKRP